MNKFVWDLLWLGLFGFLGSLSVFTLDDFLILQKLVFVEFLIENHSFVKVGFDGHEIDLLLGVHLLKAVGVVLGAKGINFIIGGVDWDLLLFGLKFQLFVAALSLLSKLNLLLASVLTLKTYLLG